MKKILFVDEEQNVLKGLSRMLHSMRSQWSVSFADNGFAALKELESQSYDVIVSDIRIPRMDGAQFLDQVILRCPNIVRIILSGQSDEKDIIRFIGRTHRFVSKPCNAETLKDTISRACDLRDLLSNSRIKDVITKINALPSLPSLYVKLLDELKNPDATVQSISKIISKDVGMVTRMLHLVNSAFFGNYSKISSPERAVSVLGMKTISALVLSASVFCQFDKSTLRAFKIEKMTEHCMNTAEFIRTITKSELTDHNVIDDSVTAGMLHDVGKLILASSIPHKYCVALENARANGKQIWLAEREMFGASHDEIGAYLLALWGLPDSVVEAVAYHHIPSKCSQRGFTPLTAVHLCDFWEHQEYSKEEFGPMPELEKGYIENLGFDKKLSGWRSNCLEARQQRMAA